MNSTSFEPVRPSGMMLLFRYVCPLCKQELSVQEPTSPEEIRCVNCGTRFPILPVDPHLIDYIHLMTDSGRAAVDENFI